MSKPNETALPLRDLLDGMPEPADGFLMDARKCIVVAREAPGYTTFELALVCLARHYVEAFERMQELRAWVSDEVAAGDESLQIWVDRIDAVGVGR